MNKNSIVSTFERWEPLFPSWKKSGVIKKAEKCWCIVDYIKNRKKNEVFKLKSDYEK